MKQWQKINEQWVELHEDLSTDLYSIADSITVGDEYFSKSEDKQIKKMVNVILDMRVDGPSALKKLPKITLKSLLKL